MPRRATKSRTTTHPPPERVYKSHPRLRQRRLVAPAGPFSTPPSAHPPPPSLYRQQTLTQLVDLSSNSNSDEDEEGEREEKEENEERQMIIDDSTEESSESDARQSFPSRKRKRTSEEVDEVQKRQSTLTQIDFFHAPAIQISSDEIYGVVHEDDPGVVLPEYQEPDVPISPPGTRKSKQREFAVYSDNTLPTPTTLRAPHNNNRSEDTGKFSTSRTRAGNIKPSQTLSPSKQSSSATNTILRSPLHARSSNRPQQPSPPQTAFRTRLPRTPKKPIKLEIPSSQTPPTTPLTLPRSTRHRDALSSPSRPPRSPLALVTEHILSNRDAPPPLDSPSARRRRHTGVIPTKFEIKETTEEDIENFMPASLLSNICAASTTLRHLKDSPSSIRAIHTQHTTQPPTSLPLPWPLPSSNPPFSHPSPQIPSSPPLPTIDSLLRDQDHDIVNTDIDTTHHSDILRSSQASTVDLGSSPPAPVLIPTSSLQSGRVRIIASSKSQTQIPDDHDFTSSSPAHATYHTPPQHNPDTHPHSTTSQPPSTHPHHRQQTPNPPSPTHSPSQDSNIPNLDMLHDNDNETDISSQPWFAFSGEPGETQAARLEALETQGFQSLAESGDVIGATQLLGESLAW